MTDKAVIDDDETVLLTDVEPEAEPEAETEAQAEPEAEEEAEELIVTIGEEAPPQEDDDDGKPAPPWVRDVRKRIREKTEQNREQARKIRELEQQLAQTKPREQQTPQLGPKPTLESVDYDTAAFEKALDDWKERKATHDRKQAEQQDAVRKEQARWEAEIGTFNEQKASLKVRDFEDAEGAVTEVLNQTQLGIIIDGAQNKALVMYALGKNEVALKDLASITNPVKFAFAIAKLETQLKTQSRKPASAPEKTLKGSAPVAANNTLDRLRADAEKSGDYTKVLAYKKQMKAQGS
jgi:hypothetical protein